MTILVTGATGTIGRHITEQLAAQGHVVRALTRNAKSANLPDGVDVVEGDLTRPESIEPVLEGVSAMHLISFNSADYAALATGREILTRAAAAGVKRVTVLTGQESELAVAEAVAASGLQWTHVRPGVDYMANKLEWAKSIAAGEPVRAAFGGFRTALIHEADVASVIVAALTSDGHHGRTYAPTGPHIIGRAEAAKIIGEVTGERVEFVELSRGEALEKMLTAGITEEAASFVLDYEENQPETSTTVTDVVERLTGRPPRTFEEWIREHADRFQQTG